MMNTQNLSQLSHYIYSSIILKYKYLINKVDKNIVILLGLPLLLTFLNNSWILSSICSASKDRWIYLGYFLDLKTHLNAFVNTYYGARLPWILPGALIYKLLPPLVAAYTLQLGVLYSSVLSLYLILKRTIGQNTALFTALFMSLNYFFLAAVGSTYMDGAGLTYLLLTLCMLTPKEGNPGRVMRVYWAGIFFSCAVYTQLFLLNYSPLLLFYFFYITQYRSALSSTRNLCLIILGCLSATLFFCTVNYLLNGNFLFFLPNQYPYYLKRSHKLQRRLY